jgi:hypothetical protein
MRQLLELFRRIAVQCQEGTSNENKDQLSSDCPAKPEQQTKSSATTALATPEQRATTGSLEEHDTNLLANDAIGPSKAGGGPW